jgi:hypothetical protein
MTSEVSASLLGSKGREEGPFPAGGHSTIWTSQAPPGPCVVPAPSGTPLPASAWRCGPGYTLVRSSGEAMMWAISPSTSVSGSPRSPTPGPVLVSGTVHDLVFGSGIAFQHRGARTLRGVPGKWRVFAALSQG